jgi:hypothetical protein
VLKIPRQRKLPPPAQRSLPAWMIYDRHLTFQQETVPLLAPLQTLSTRGRETRESLSKPMEYVILHYSVEVYGPQKPRILWDAFQAKFLSIPASMTAMEGSVFNLVFDELEMRQAQSDVEGKIDYPCLVIYAYDFQLPMDGQTEECTLISCAVQKLRKNGGSVGKRQHISGSVVSTMFNLGCQ